MNRMADEGLGEGGRALRRWRVSGSGVSLRLDCTTPANIKLAIEDRTS